MFIPVALLVAIVAGLVAMVEKDEVKEGGEGKVKAKDEGGNK